MSPTVPPESGDIDMWSQALAVFGRVALAAVLWLERMLPIILPATAAAYLYGKRFGYRGAALRLFVVTGVFAAIVGTPVALWTLGLDVNLWQTVICCGLSVFCVKMIDWAEAWIVKQLGIDRRHEGNSDE